MPVDVLAVVAEHRGCAPAELADGARRVSGQPALEHLFAVTAGLESRIVGEPETCGQSGARPGTPCRAGTGGRVLVPAFSAAVRCAGRVRDVTSLGREQQSWGHRAVQAGLARGPVDRVVVVGAGRMAAQVVGHLRRRGLRPEVLARDEAVAARLAGAAAVRRWSELDEVLGAADLLVVATAARSSPVTAPQVARARAGRTSGLTVVDLSVPRAVDADVAQVEGVRLLGVEALGDDDHGTAVTAAAEVGWLLVRSEVQRYLDRGAARRAGPLLAALRRSVEQACLEELARTAPYGTGAQELAQAMSGRLLHRTTLVARAAAAAGDTAVLALLADVFALPEGSGDHGRTPRRVTAASHVWRWTPTCALRRLRQGGAVADAVRRARPDGRADMVELVEVRVLGSLAVRTSAGEVVDPAVWRTAKTRDLVRLLALRAGQSVAVDALVEALWPNVDLDRGWASLRTAASQVRQVLGQQHLVRRTGGLLLTGVWVDALAFEALVSSAGQHLAAGRPAQAVRSAWEALGLYVGDLGAEEASAEWCTADREHYRRLRRQLALDAAEAAADLGWLRDAVELGHLALRLDPCAERGYRLLMRGYAQLGETEQALGMYERCRTALAEAFGADPSAATSELHLQVLTPLDVPEPRPPLLGRDAVLDRVRASVDAVLDDAVLDDAALERDRTAACVLHGPVGSGRSRLADEVTGAWPHRTVRVRCDSDEQNALRRHVTALAHRPAAEPVLLVVEHLELAGDQDVVELVRLLRDDDGPLLVLATQDDADTGIGAAALDGVACDVVALPALMREEIAALLRAVLGGAPSEALLDELLASSGGRPGAAVRLAAGLLRSGELLSTGTGMVRAQWHSRLPVVHAATRLAQAREQTGPLGAEVVEVLAVLDRPTEAEALTRLVPGSVGEVLGVLRQLHDLGVVRRSERGYRMQDQVVTEAARSWLRGSARCELHWRVAEHAVLPPGERAEHWSAAGEPALACAAWLEAAEDALVGGDDVRGRTYLLRVGRFADERSVDVQDRIALHERLADVERRLGRPAEALRLLLEAEDLARTSPHGVRARLQLRRTELAPLLGAGGGWTGRDPATARGGPGDLRASLDRAAALVATAPDAAVQELERVVGEADAAEDVASQVRARLLLARAAGTLRSSLPTAYAAARTAGVLAESLEDRATRVRAALAAVVPPVLLGAGARERRGLEALRQRATGLGDPEVLYEVLLPCCLVLHELASAELAHLWASVSALAERREDRTGLQLLDALVSLEHGALRRSEHLLDDLPLRFDAVLVDHGALLVRARLRDALGDRPGAVELLRQLVEDPRLPSPGLLTAEGGARLALLSAADDPALARRRLADAVAATGPRAYPREQVCLLRARAAILSAEGRDEAGATLALAAAHAAGHAGLLHQQAESYLLRTRLLRQAGDDAGARRSTERGASLRHAAGVSPSRRSAPTPTPAPTSTGAGRPLLTL